MQQGEFQASLCGAAGFQAGEGEEEEEKWVGGIRGGAICSRTHFAGELLLVQKNNRLEG